MNREYNCKVSSKNSKRLLKNLQNTIGDYFFAAPCRSSYTEVKEGRRSEGRISGDKKYVKKKFRIKGYTDFKT